MANVFEVCVWVSCLLVPTLAQVNDCSGDGCAEESMHFDFLQVKQTLVSMPTLTKTGRAPNSHVIGARYLEKTAGCVDGDWHEDGEESHNCAWAGEDPAYRCSDKVNADGLQAWQLCTLSCGNCGGCTDGDWHEIGEASHDCAWAGEDPSYRCSETANVDGLKAWEVCKQSCGLCEGCADGDWHEVGEESHDCAWAGEDPSYRCSDTANANGLKAWQVCTKSCGLCVPPCADGDWHEFGVGSHNCAWAGEDPSYRCSDATNGDGLKAWEVCKQSCGLCDDPCVDDPAWHEASDPSHDCAWVLQTMAIDPSTCASAMSGGVSPVPAWMGCPMACGSCPEEPSVLNDPHMTSLRGDKFDINQPAEYVLLRAPVEHTQTALFELRATMEADEVKPCGLYVKAVTLSGTWFGGAIVHVRPLKRNKAGPNTAGNVTEWPLSMQVSSQGPWMPFSEFSAGNSTEVLTDTVKVTANSREQFGGLLEGQAFTFHIGRSGRPALIVVSQAAHQALNVELANMKALKALGQPTLGGLLGTEKHDKGVEELTKACKTYKKHQATEKGKSALLVASHRSDTSRLSASWS